nr:16S rRNA (cytidine(1402)-2'-O)-methyltransferase [Buchnera aphidicola]
MPTPIGNLQDISYRALHILKSVNLILSESIQHTLILLKKFSIKNIINTLNKHNEYQKTFQYVTKLLNGQNIALVSKAGTPLLNDPGYLLVNLAYKKKIRIVPVPGACAAITALSACNIQTTSFCYEGFFPSLSQERIKKIKKIKYETRTLIFYESPKRIMNTLKDLKKEIEITRKIMIARELTKIWEQILTGTLQEILLLLKNNLNWQKGEIVIIIEGYKNKKKNIISPKMKKIFNILLKEISFSNSIKIMNKIYGIKKNFLYNKMINKNTLNKVN